MYTDLQLNLDGSYTFTKNGMPYNCPNNGEWVQEFSLVDTWANENPKNVKLEEIYVRPIEDLKTDAKQNLENLTARLREEQSTFNGITIAKTYENINEWLTFAKYKADENISIPAQAVMMSYSGQNMNAFSVPQIEGAMYQAMLAITTINANYYSTLASIENATTAEEIPNIQG